MCKHIIHGTISKDNKYKLLTWFRWPDVNWFLQEDRFWNSAEHIRWAWTSLFSRFADDFVVTFDLISVFYLVFLFLNCLKSFLLDFSFVSRQCFWAHRLIIIWMTWNCIKKIEENVANKEMPKHWWRDSLQFHNQKTKALSKINKKRGITFVTRILSPYLAKYSKIMIFINIQEEQMHNSILFPPKLECSQKSRRCMISNRDTKTHQKQSILHVVTERCQKAEPFRN